MVTNRIAREVLYRGRVQGVGFRFNAQHIARRFEVKGFVRNLDDGRVQLIAVGSTVEVEKFLAAVAESMAGNITQAAVSEVPPSDEYGSFEIRA